MIKGEKFNPNWSLNLQYTKLFSSVSSVLFEINSKEEYCMLIPELEHIGSIKEFIQQVIQLQKQILDVEASFKFQDPKQPIKDLLGSSNT